MVENGSKMEIKRDKSKIWFTGDDLNSSLRAVSLYDSSKVQTVTSREVPEVNTYFDILTSLILPNLAPEILLNHKITNCLNHITDEKPHQILEEFNVGVPDRSSNIIIWAFK